MFSKLIYSQLQNITLAMAITIYLRQQKQRELQTPTLDDPDMQKCHKTPAKATISKGLLTRVLLLTRKIRRLHQAIVKVAAQWDVSPQVI